jgi:hydroxyethylthiazole kinase-like uncharacterized protein yjeF
MEILTAAEMNAVDRRTTDEFGVPLSTLMENAGSAVAGFCLRHYAGAERIVVLCGKGNNGGDGLVAARILSLAGLQVDVFLLGREEDVKPVEALRALRSETPDIAVRTLLDDSRSDELCSSIAAADLLIDAVVGTGFKPPLRGLAATLCDMLESATAPILAVDLPSGWDADSVEQNGCAFRANAVVTFTRPKMAHVFGHLTHETFGPVVVADIGSPSRLRSCRGM